ncbi:MAG: DGQHR domain-containing protein [Candidatus Electrothrix sp. ATG1]|nr:DGQHR domain-containing protein [Candidatus Electrothrix sp. ATG1]
MYLTAKNKFTEPLVIATRNIEWSQVDLEKAQHANITVLRDTELNYYIKFTQRYKLAAKYQLLAHLFANEKILGLELVVPATKGSMGGVDFYNFLIKPADLLKISHVSHKASRDVQDIETYQRLLNPNRLKKIAQYIDDGGQFPTNIVVNVRTKKKKKLRFEKIDTIGDSAFGRLYLPNQYASAMVIDGQHRLYGYAHSERIVNGKEGKATVPVLAYENLEPTREAKLFVDINCEQVRVPRNLLNEINATLYWDSEDFKLQIDALCSRIVMTLNTKPSSPVYDRVILTNKDMTSLRCLTLTNFFDGLKENKFFGEQKKSGIISTGPLTDSSSKDLEDTMNKAIKVIDGYLNFFATTAPYHWDLGKVKKEKESQIGYLATNEGIRALFRVLKELLTHIEIQTGADADTLTGEDLLKEIKKYAMPIAELFMVADYEAIAQFRSRSASKKAVLQNANHLMGFIHKQHPEFCPHGLEEYLESIDEEGTKEAEGLVAELQKQMYEFVLHKLKEKYPNGDDWWYEGVPSKVRTQCTARCEEEKGIKSKEQYLKLIDYHSIAMSNWQGCFQGSFSFTKDGGKDKQLKWIKDLNCIRNITHHPEKWPASKKQVEFVRDIHRKGMERFMISE